ncbi:hypothetical protein QAD02_012416 [Eretmocerus hayati]|uniref:Uncharacterized protein n=1 Tax=Eretmocerus hayati TaxID=131215 RepID=A0ACC2NZE4_9HYME|nr:hypothetical protein QAD02_012416 [Eretmocerus hayati]
MGSSSVPNLSVLRNNAKVAIYLRESADFTSRAQRKDSSITAFQGLLRHTRNELIAIIKGGISGYDEVNGTREKGSKCRPVDRERRDAHIKLLQDYSHKGDGSLMEALLISLQVFNRKRQGEISRFKKGDCETKNISRLDPKIGGAEVSVMSLESQEAAKSYVRLSLVIELCQGTLN